MSGDVATPRLLLTPLLEDRLESSSSIFSCSCKITAGNKSVNCSEEVCFSKAHSRTSAKVSQNTPQPENKPEEELRVTVIKQVSQ